MHVRGPGVHTHAIEGKYDAVAAARKTLAERCVFIDVGFSLRWFDRVGDSGADGNLSARV